MAMVPTDHKHSCLFIFLDLMSSTLELFVEQIELTARPHIIFLWQIETVTCIRQPDRFRRLGLIPFPHFFWRSKFLPSEKNKLK